MKSVLPIRLLLATAICLVAAPAGAAPFTVFWDGAAGLGVSQTTATNASAAGIPIVQAAGFQLVNGLQSADIDRVLDLSSLVIAGTANINATWSVVNDTGASLQDLYLVFEKPIPTTTTVILNGVFQPVTYDPSDVGLTLGAGWQIFQVDVNSIPVYYPAVSLGTLANGANAPFPLSYVLDNPQVFIESFNFELGMPAWNLFFVSVPVPEPASGLLVLLGVLGIAGGRRKRS